VPTSRLILALVLTISGTLPIFAQVDTAWVRRYNGPGDGHDEAKAVAYDDSGNVFVTGASFGAGTNDDYVTIKYKPNGDNAWVRRYNGPGNWVDRVTDVAVDTGGNVIVTGYSYGGVTDFDWVTIKYLPNGDTGWVRIHDGNASGSDGGQAIAVDDSGNVYVAGNVTTFHFVSFTTNYDYLTIKYLPNGDVAWARTYNAPGDSADIAWDIALDDSGNVFVTGEAWNLSPLYWQYTTLKYSSAGTLLWDRHYSGNDPDQYYEGANAIAVSGSGNVYVTGTSNYDTSLYFSDYATIRYYPNGDTAWVRRYNYPFNYIDGALDIDVDASGNSYVTGFSYGFLFDYATVKYLPNGDTGWVRRYYGTGFDENDGGQALVVDDSGNVYVTGNSWRAHPSDSGYDYATIKYKPNGDTAWTRVYDGPASSDDIANDIVVDPSGNVYVTGYSTGIGTSGDVTTIKYTQCSAKAGDANASGTYTLGDAIAIVNYVFSKPGCVPLPTCWLSGLLCRGDWNGTGTVTLGDAIRAVNYIFNKPGGPWDALPIGVCCL